MSLEICTVKNLFQILRRKKVKMKDGLITWVNISYYRIWPNIFKKRFLTTCCSLRNSPEPLTSSYSPPRFASFSELINFTFSPRLIAVSFLAPSITLLILNLWPLASFFHYSANPSILLFWLQHFSSHPHPYALTLALGTSAPYIIKT